MASEHDEILPALGLVSPDEAYDPFASEKYENPLAKGLLTGTIATVKGPGELSSPNPYPPGSELGSWFEDQRQKGMLDWSHHVALNNLRMGLMAGPADAGSFAAGGANKLLSAYKEKYPQTLSEQFASSAQSALSAPVDIWKADTSKLAPGQLVQAGPNGPVGTFQGLSPGGTTLVNWKKGAAAEAPAGAAAASPAPVTPNAVYQQIAAKYPPGTSTAKWSDADFEKYFAANKAFEGASAAVPNLSTESGLPSNKGYTLSSAAGKGDFPEAQNDYFVHDPAGNKIGELTHYERRVTLRDDQGKPISWQSPGWELSMPGVAPKAGSSLEGLMQFIPAWHKGTQEAAPSLSAAVIEAALKKNPGASLGELAGVSSPWKAPPAGQGVEGPFELGKFPKEVPFQAPSAALAHGFVTPALHGTRLGEYEWAPPGAPKGWTAADLGGLGALHAAGKDALRLPSDELGVHFGTSEQAHYFTGNTLAGEALPRTYPAVLQTGRSLELPDMGTWEVWEIHNALNRANIGEGHGFSHGAYRVSDPEAHIGEFPRSERRNLQTIQQMRDYLHSKGYDSVNYINSVEGPGQRSYIMFKPSPEEPEYVAGVRSPFAAFDPSKLARPELAAGLAGAVLAPALASPFLFDDQGRPYVATK